MPIKQRHLRIISRRFWGIFFGTIIALAVLVQIGRQAFPLVNDYKPIIEKSLGDQLGVLVDIGQISAEWQGLRPKVILNEVLVQSHAGEEIFYIDTALAELSLIDSFIQRGPAWRTITFKSFRTTFEQKENYSWGIKGYDGGTANTENPFLFDDPLDIFLFGRRVQIESASLNFQFNNGKRTELSIPAINLENDRFFHRMTASLSIEGKQSLRFVMEGYGDPRNKARFSASGYLGLTDIPTTDIYNALFNKDDTELEANDPSSREQVTNVEFWFKGSPQAGMTASGAISVSGLPKDLEAHFDLPDRFEANITGAWKDGAGWFANLQDINVDWAGNKLPLETLSFYGQGRDVGLRVKELDVTSLIEVATAANRAGETKASQVISSLKPRGVLRNIDVSLRSKKQGYFLAKMYVEGGAANAFMGSPALENINGYVETSLFDGYVDANIEEAFKLDLVKVFDTPIILNDVVGQLAWRIDLKNKIAYLKSSGLSATQNQSNALGAFSMTLPFKREIGEQTMTLQVEVDQSDVSNYKNYLPKHVPDSLKAWLSSALNGGQAKNIGVFYNGSVSKSPSHKPIYQIVGDVSGATLTYDPKWPAISNVAGSIVIDSDSFKADVISARTSGAEISEATVQLGARVNGRMPDIQITADVAGETKAAQHFLINSPLSENLSSFLAQWELSGDFKSSVSLSIPVEFDEDKIDYKVKTSLKQNVATMKSVGLNFEKVSGDFLYSKSGLAESEGLTVSLWGNEVKPRIESDRASGDVSVLFSAPVNVAELKQWVARPELFALQQDFDVRGKIVIPTTRTSDTKVPEINLTSDLKGVALDLPSPLGKKAQDIGEYGLNIRFADSGVDYRYSHNNLAFMDMAISNTEAPAVSIQLGEEQKGVLTSPGQVVVEGRLEHADFDAWLQAYTRYIAETEQIALNQSNPKKHDEDDELQPEMVTMANISIDTFSFGELLFPDLDLNITSRDQDWLFSMLSERAVGSVTVPLSEAPIKLEFESLSLSPNDKGEVSEPAPIPSEENIKSVFADANISDFVAMDVSIAELSIQGEDWGRWQFLLEPIDSGIHLSQFRADFKHLKIGQASPSQFYWTRNGEQNLSHFKGQIEVADVADTLKAWGQEPIVTSKSGVFNIRAQWLAEPDMVSLANLNGDVEFSLLDGSFVRATQTGENPLLRLIALFNFDTLARRLRLDFSDLAKRGFAYDSVSSNVNFTNGIATLSEPVIVASSSSRMQMAGTVDLINEEVDAELVVTLPVASNIAVATAFLVGVPAGVGVYIVSKMLGKTVDKASSINYSVEGDWEDPKIKVRKIFDDQAALRKAEKLKEEKAVQMDIDQSGAPERVETSDSEGQDTPTVQ